MIPATGKSSPASLRIAAFSGGADVPSARLRVHQLQEPLRRRGIDMALFDAHRGSFPPHTGWGARLGWFTGELAQRAVQVLRARRETFSGSLVHREFVSTVPTLEALVPDPMIFDVDDAIWLLRRGVAARSIARRSELVLAGNGFLADYFGAFADVRVVPTAVDLSYYRPAVAAPRRLSIGWCGTSSNFRYLSLIEEPLRRLLQEHPDAEFAVMSDRRPELGLPVEQVRFQPWSYTDEPAFLNGLSVGVVPLADGAWERGKCAYKMLACMASAVPVVASPVGMNAELLSEAEIGCPAVHPADWVDALATLLGDSSQRERLGRAGRELAERSYSVEAISERVASAVLECI